MVTMFAQMLTERALWLRRSHTVVAPDLLAGGLRRNRRTVSMSLKQTVSRQG